MLDTPQVTETADQLTATIHLVIPQAEIRSVMGPSIREVFAALSAQGIAPAGPWFTHHRRRPSETFDLEVCVPVAAPVAVVGRVRPGSLPAARVARTVYQGPYEDLGAAWGELFDWIAANGLSPRADLWECYLVGPESGIEPGGYRTELNCPLAG